MSRRAVLICVAIQLEAKAIARALELTFDASRLRATGILPPDLPVQLRIVGVRAVSMPASLDAAEVGLVISAGLAGALDPKLQCGDVVRDAQIHTASDIVATIAQKQALFGQTGRAAVDMESGHIQQVAERSGIPCTAIRAISDTADEAIDPSVLGLIDTMGRPKPMAVLAALSRNPRRLSTLLRLRRNSQLAAQRLGEHLAEFLRSLAFLAKD